MHVTIFMEMCSLTSFLASAMMGDGDKTRDNSTKTKIGNGAERRDAIDCVVGNGNEFLIISSQTISMPIRYHWQMVFTVFSVHCPCKRNIKCGMGTFFHFPTSFSFLFFFSFFSQHTSVHESHHEGNALSLRQRHK